MDLDEQKNIVETEYLKLLSHYLKTGKITLPDAKEATREFLAFLPFTDFSDMQYKLKSFTDSHPYFQEIYITFLNNQEAKNTAKVINQMKSLIKENKVDEALNLVK